MGEFIQRRVMHYQSVTIWLLVIACAWVIKSLLVGYYTDSSNYGPILACEQPTFKHEKEGGIKMYVACGEHKGSEVQDKDFIVQHLNSPRQFTCAINKLGYAKCAQN